MNDQWLLALCRWLFTKHVLQAACRRAGRVRTRVALLGISVHDNIRDCRHDLLDQTVCQHGHPLMVVLFAQTPRFRSLRPLLTFDLLRLFFFFFTSISCWAMLQAAPRPTASGVGTVPERKPLSCPPPFCSGSKRTRGRRRTYRAPTPVHTHTHTPEAAVHTKCFYMTFGFALIFISLYLAYFYESIRSAPAHLWVRRVCGHWWTSDQPSSRRRWWESFQQPEQHQCGRKLP